MMMRKEQKNRYGLILAAMIAAASMTACEGQNWFLWLCSLYLLHVETVTMLISVPASQMRYPQSRQAQ